MSKFPITINGAELLRAELQRMKTVDRPNVIAAIAEARSHGDLSENAEYDAAKESWYSRSSGWLGSAWLGLAVGVANNCCEAPPGLFEVAAPVNKLQEMLVRAIIRIKTSQGALRCMRTFQSLDNKVILSAPNWPSGCGDWVPGLTGHLITTTMNRDITW